MNPGSNIIYVFIFKWRDVLSFMFHFLWDVSGFDSLSDLRTLPHHTPVHHLFSLPSAGENTPIVIQTHAAKGGSGPGEWTTVSNTEVQKMFSSQRFVCLHESNCNLFDCAIVIFFKMCFFFDPVLYLFF